MNKFSLTYIGIIITVLAGLGVTVPVEDLEKFFAVGQAIIGGLIAAWGRFRAGGINIFGVRKPQ